MIASTRGVRYDAEYGSGGLAGASKGGNGGRPKGGRPRLLHL